MRFRTRAIHVGNETDPLTGAIIPPIHLATTFVQPGPGEVCEFDYSRSGNPTRARFELAVANLEGGAGGLAFASGMAAIHNVMMLLAPGDHVIAGTDIYGGTYRLLHGICERIGIGISHVSPTPDSIAKAITSATKIVWLETPGNPLLSITDLEACAAVAKERGVLVGVDNTFATPVLTRPLELGADIVVHSATKYIGGHSDVLGGAVVAKEKSLRDRLYYIQNATGAVMNPWEAYLSSRGLKTLELRIREHCRSAMTIATFLADHPRVRKVYYPGLPSHPGHDVAARQMVGGFGGVVSFELDGDLEQSSRFVKSTKLFRLAVSLGAVESLIGQPARMSHASYAAEDRRRHGISDSLIRMSVGLEDVEDLKDDLAHAFSMMG